MAIQLSLKSLHEPAEERAIALGLPREIRRDTIKKTVVPLSKSRRDLVERTRARKLRGQELSGATFTVSNLGMFPVDEFSAIINPPEGAILAVGAVRKVPAVVDDEIRLAQRMRLTLSCDHRVVDGATAARFLQGLTQTLERPLRLLL